MIRWFCHVLNRCDFYYCYYYDYIVTPSIHFIVLSYPYIVSHFPVEIFGVAFSDICHIYPMAWTTIFAILFREFVKQSQLCYIYLGKKDIKMVSLRCFWVTLRSWLEYWNYSMRALDTHALCSIRNHSLVRK